MSELKGEEICQNCKYFKRYYIISATLSFVATEKGFCTNIMLNNKVSSKYIRKKEGCYLWQPYELEKLKQQYLIEKLLIKIDKQIENILAIIRDIE